jgi:excisionase family DNA binding protein
MWGDIQKWDTNVESQWLTANEAAQYLKVKPRTLLQWARERKIPAHKLSGVQRCVWRFLRPELDAILCPSSADSADGRQH